MTDWTCFPQIIHYLGYKDDDCNISAELVTGKAESAVLPCHHRVLKDYFKSTIKCIYQSKTNSICEAVYIKES